MATYTIALNERTSTGKALMAYLEALGVLVSKVTPKAKSSYLRPQEDKLAARMEKLAREPLRVADIHLGWQPGSLA